MMLNVFALSRNALKSRYDACDKSGMLKAAPLTPIRLDYASELLPKVRVGVT
jgi:hypothetical protein